MNQPFAEDPPRTPPLPETLIVSFESWEGPLDLLLNLARHQKIDLAKIPILPLVEQYLAFIQKARALKLEIAADYLVMAAWLAYLKSALLLPREEQPDPDPNLLAERLRWRLQRLEAMRDAADRLMQRDLLGRDVFARGKPEGLRTVRQSQWDATLYDLLQAYGALNQRPKPGPWTPHNRGAICTLEDALQRLSSLIGTALDWTELAKFLPTTEDRQLARSTLASSFVAALELTRTGQAELTQSGAFGPLMLRMRSAG
ncbi:segregation/condensation protein A [Sandaracinobacter neustonicus]|uniref:Segregation and condensation protein A n=1 Tax=Sandaracinobacter neustonicus TaxID=1715348 RepID=A0A501XFW2_9SPHN|nr:ScpA family protein [Sandaracinobacter neustonicus]TPE59217.1 segregation/condensation protein A [Sandaracinobacter neustonicus]